MYSIRVIQRSQLECNPISYRYLTDILDTVLFALSVDCQAFFCIILQYSVTKRVF